MSYLSKTMKLLDRNKAILTLCQNKSVLHLGCVGFTDLTLQQRIELLPNTLHAQIYKVAYKLTGLDYSKKVIDVIKDVEAFNSVYFANAEKLKNLELKETFETIVVGDLIEHLSNPGLMLNGLRRFCTPSTVIVFTTPNAFGIAGFLRYFLKKFKEGDEHVMSFNLFNFQNLLERHHFKTIEINTCYQQHAKKMKLFPLLKLMLSIFPKFGGTIFLTAKMIV